MDDLRLIQAVHGPAGYWWSRTTCRGEGESLNLVANGQFALMGRSLVQPQSLCLKMSVLLEAVECDTFALLAILLASMHKTTTVCFALTRAELKSLPNFTQSARPMP